MKEGNVLIVEDSDSSRDLFRILINMVCPRISTYTARNFSESLDILSSSNINIAIIDLDLNDIKGDGLDLARLIKKHYKNIFIILSSATIISDVDFVRLCEDRIIDYFMPKPLTIDSLKKTINAIKEEKCYA